ncbi:MAG: hypothetical protein WCE65_06995 [Methanoregula sp.]
MYSVKPYLNTLKLAKRSQQTITYYHSILKKYAAFLGISPDYLRTRLDATNLIDYPASLYGGVNGE